MSDPKLPFVMTIAQDRDDKGSTMNYKVFNVPVQVAVKNKRGEIVQKNAVMGGNGTVYIAHELTPTDEPWVMLPKAMFDALISGAAPKVKTTPTKGKGKK